MKTVKEISELTGISIRALRYYDEIGLLTPTERSEAGYRLYDEKALEKLNAILFLRELDVPLTNIKDIINSEDKDYGIMLKGYRKNLVQRINKLQGLLEVLDGFALENTKIDFHAFCDADAKKVAEALMDTEGVEKTDRETNLIEIEELVKQNVVDGKVGIELLQIYGSKEKYLSSIEESTLHPEVSIVLQEELKDIYFAFRDFSGELDQTRELVKRLENNTKKMYRTSNARYILLKIAEDYLSKGKTAQVLDEVYGKGVTDTIGKAINAYYGV